MKNPFALLSLCVLVGLGCDALNSLIIHPLSVVHQIHESNEQAAEIRQANSTNHFSNFSGH